MLKYFFVLIFSFMLGLSFSFLNYEEDVLSKVCSKNVCVDVPNIDSYPEKDRFIILNSISSGVCLSIKDAMSQYSDDERLFNYLSIKLEECYDKKFAEKQSDERLYDYEYGWFTWSDELVAT